MWMNVFILESGYVTRVGGASSISSVNQFGQVFFDTFTVSYL